MDLLVFYDWKSIIGDELSHTAIICRSLSFSSDASIVSQMESFVLFSLKVNYTRD